MLNHELHDKDFYAWTKETAKLLKEGRINEVDMNNIAGELEDMGNSEKRSVVSQLSRLIAHLLKWKYQPINRGTSWKATIEDARLELADFLSESITLKNKVESEFKNKAIVYRRAVNWASRETGIEKKVFPKDCPFTLEQCLDEEFLPE
jgi:hypothetical protein